MDIREIYRNINVETRAYVNGEYIESEGRKTIIKHSSFSGVLLPEITACGETEAEKAVQCAKEAFDTGTWRKKDPQEKKRIMLKLADLMEENRQELAVLDTIETSRAYRNYYYDSIPKAIEAIRYFAEGIDKYYDSAVPPRESEFAVITRCPLGVVAIITPWNDPLVVAAWKFAPALLMGNSVILKPAEQSSLSLIRLAELTARAGLPRGVFNVLPGYGEEIGKKLALHNQIRGIFFTGSSQTGKQILQYAGISNMKKAGLECGGKSPFLISKNYRNLEKAAGILAENVFYNQGQICSAPTRAIVDKAVKQEFLGYLKKQAERFIPGNPYDIENEVGCVVSREQFDKIKHFIIAAEEQGAEVWQAQGTRGDMPAEACYIQPTVITGISNQAEAARKEIFGPVVVLLEADGTEDAVKLANDTDYGLAAAVFTDNLDEAYYAAHRIQAGLVHINSYGRDDNMAPFGGVKESGIGKDKSLWAFDEYSQQKTVWMQFEDIGGAFQ